MAKKKNKSFNWFNSTILILLLLFSITLPLSIYRFGIEKVLDQLLLWGLGTSAVSIVLYITKKILKL